MKQISQTGPETQRQMSLSWEISHSCLKYSRGIKGTKTHIYTHKHTTWFFHILCCFHWYSFCKWKEKRFNLSFPYSSLFLISGLIGQSAMPALSCSNWKWDTYQAAFQVKVTHTIGRVEPLFSDALSVFAISWFRPSILSFLLTYSFMHCYWMLSSWQPTFRTDNQKQQRCTCVVKYAWERWRISITRVSQ